MSSIYGSLCLKTPASLTSWAAPQGRTSHVPFIWLWQCSKMPCRVSDRDLIKSAWWFQPTPLKNMTSSIGMMKFPMSTPLKNMKVNWDYYSQYMESHKIPWFQSPPTRNAVAQLSTTPGSSDSAVQLSPETAKVVSRCFREKSTPAASIFTYLSCGFRKL